MSNVIPANFGRASSKFAVANITNEAAAGIESGYGVMKYKGKVWSVDYRGDTKSIMRPDGDGPANSIEVVIIKASGVKSKLYYEGYVDGANNKPVCWSANGVTPDQRVLNKQANACAICPKNQPGSKVDENGEARGRACRDNKRIAIVPLGDMENDLYGGPMLLRIPAASLNDFAQFTRELEKFQLPYCAVGVKIAFDPAQAYPKFVFSVVRVLDDEEADVVLSLRDDPRVTRIVAEEGDTTPQVAANPMLANLGPASTKFAGVADAPAPVAAAAPKAAPKPAPKAAPKPAPAPVANDEGANTGTSIDDELDALLG